jgi:hypothetical protein
LTELGGAVAGAALAPGPQSGLDKKNLEAQFELEKSRRENFDPLANVRASINGKIQAAAIKDMGENMFDANEVNELGIKYGENPYLTDPSERLLGFANALENPAQFNLVDDGQGGLKNAFGEFGDTGIGTYEKARKGGFWGKVGKIAGIAGTVVGAAATGGAASPLLAAAITAGGTAASAVGAGRAANSQDREAQNQFAAEAEHERAFNPGGRLQDAIRGELQAISLEEGDAGAPGRFAKEISSLRNDDLLKIRPVDVDKDGVPDLYKQIFGPGPFPPDDNKEEREKQASAELYRNPYVEIL